jgi:hypothetical protein
MKLQEVNDYYNNLSDEALLEHVEQHNDTGFRSQDVAQVIRMANDPTGWSKPVLAEDYVKMLEDRIAARKKG